MTMAGILMLAGLNASAVALAQTPSPATSVPTQLPAPGLVLVPYEEDAKTTDPHAVAITQTFAKDLATAGVAVTVIPPLDHLDAVAGAAKICADNHATALLIPEGRYEQTLKRVPIGLLTTIYHYPVHVEFRLDEVGCDGTIRWSTTTTGDQNPGGMGFSPANLGSYVDTAFRAAELTAAQAFAVAVIPPGPTGVAAVTAPATPLVGPTSYLLLPLGQPTIADPHIADVTHSLLVQLQARKLDVKLGTPMDHLSAITGAAKLCAANGTQAIIVPNVRVEQSSFSGRSHASMHVALLSCGGAVLAHGAGEADMGGGGNNFGAGVTAVSERAMPLALDQLFPATATAAPAVSPTPGTSN